MRQGRQRGFKRLQGVSGGASRVFHGISREVQAQGGYHGRSRGLRDVLGELRGVSGILRGFQVGSSKFLPYR